MKISNEWTEANVSILEVQKLLDQGYEVEVDSPDGYVPVNYFVDKGQYDEYVFEGDDGVNIRCNHRHLFEQIDGQWIFAEDMEKSGETYKLKGRNGIVRGRVVKTGNKIPIVDINVNHPNHRYYTENVSSHNTGVGKTLFMTHCAGANLLEGLNVLYITMEMAEERIAERIDANLLDVTLDDLELLTREAYTSRIGRVKSRTTGKLVIKEYPTTTAGAAHFRHLLNELRLKKNFTPDIVYIDYLNICTSSRLRYGANVNSYTLVKSIAEELRGLAVEFNVPIVSATQTNRTGYTSSDVGLEDTSESFGLPATADFMFAMISTEELEELGQVMVKQLKNRWGDISNPKRFVVGIDRSKMRLFDAEDSAQEGLMKDGNTSPKQAKSDSVMDNSDFGERLEDEIRGAHRRKKPKFEGLN
jgi:hypothetical protein